MNEKISSLEKQTRIIIWIGGGLGITALGLLAFAISGAFISMGFEIIMALPVIIFAGTVISIIQLIWALRLRSAYRSADAKPSTRTYLALALSIFGLAIASVTIVTIAYFWMLVMNPFESNLF